MESDCDFVFDCKYISFEVNSGNKKRKLYFK